MIALGALIAAGIPLSDTDGTALLKATAALEWLKYNTTLEVDTEDLATIEALPATAKLFVSKYVEIMSLKTGVSSQSIEGLSLSFDTTDKGAMLWQLANSLLNGYVKQVRVFPAKKRWSSGR